MHTTSTAARRTALLAAAAVGLSCFLVGCTGQVNLKPAAFQPPLTTASATPPDGASPAATSQVGTNAAGASSPSAASAPAPASSTEQKLPRDDPSGAPIFDGTSDLSTVAFPSSFDASEIANAKIWITQQQLIAHCMSGKGFDYTFQLWWQLTADEAKSKNALYPIGTPGYAAEYGTAPAGGTYDWTTAGCAGEAVHETGQDNNN